MMTIQRRILLFSLIAVTLSGCFDDTGPLPRQGAAGPPPAESLRSAHFALEAPCTIHVEGTGVVSIEDEYVANVVACENGGAPMEALKAQAVQARGYLYFAMLVTGRTTIGDSTSDQVFSCSYTSAGPRHYEAARATRGQYLSWNGHIVAPFYVAGAIPPDQYNGAPEDACLGEGGTDNTNTQRWVTYNQGRSSCDIDMTPLGWIPGDGDCNRNPQNRGCASQNGQACLARRGWFYDEMQPFHYGSDIEIRQATGTCGGLSDQPVNYDAYCMNHTEPTYCVDRGQRVHCNGNDATAVEDCSHGCHLGDCLPPPAEPVGPDTPAEKEPTNEDLESPPDESPTEISTDSGDDPSHQASLLSRSTGAGVGCTHAPATPQPPAFLLFLLVALISSRTAGRLRRQARG
jgi:hypothetical protein